MSARPFAVSSTRVAPDRSEHSRQRRAPFDRASVWPDPLVRRATRVALESAGARL